MFVRSCYLDLERCIVIPDNRDDARGVEIDDLGREMSWGVSDGNSQVLVNDNVGVGREEGIDRDGRLVDPHDGPNLVDLEAGRATGLGSSRADERRNQAEASPNDVGSAHDNKKERPGLVSIRTNERTKE